MKCKCKLRKLINKDQVQGPTVVSSVNAKRLQSLQLRKNGSAERKKRTNGREITFSLQFSLLASKSLRGWGWEEVNPISALTTFVSLLCGKLYQWNCQTIRILGWLDIVLSVTHRSEGVYWNVGHLINNTGSWAPFKRRQGNFTLFSKSKNYFARTAICQIPILQGKGSGALKLTLPKSTES